MDITKIFKSKTREALFRLYFTNPDKSYYLRELERGLDIPVSMLRKELMSLEKSGIFSSSRKANLSYYSLDKSYPLYDELKNIVFKTIGIKGLLIKALSDIKEIETAFIYGSYAKDQYNAKSDVDLFIIGNVDEDTLVSRIDKIEKDIKREINYSIYSRKDFEKKKRQKDGFIEDIIENPKIFVIGGKNDI